MSSEQLPNFGDTGTSPPRSEHEDFPIRENAKDPHRLARKFLETRRHHGGDYTLRHWRGAWLAWNGHRYKEIGEGDLKNQVNAAIKAEFDSIARRNDVAPHSVTNNAVNNVLSAMKSIVAVPAEVDAPAWLGREGNPASRLAFTNGQMLLQAALDDLPALHPPTPRWFSFTSFPLEYRPEAKAPRWEQFLRETFPDDPKSIELIQEVFGYLLTPDTSMHKFFILEGRGRNGKGVVAKVLTEVLGRDNVSAVPLEQFGDKFALAATSGKLANIVNELDRPRDLDEGTIKAFVAGDRIKVERKYRDPFEMLPTARLVITTNELPQFRDKSDGLMRRLVVLRFPVQVPEDQVNPELARELLEEKAGIFNWALEGLRRLRRRRAFAVPEASQAILEEMGPEPDSAELFLKEHVQEAPGAFSATDDLYSLYVQRVADRPLSRQHFGSAIRRVFPRARNGKGKSKEGKRPNGYHGIAMKAHVRPSGLSERPVIPFPDLSSWLKKESEVA